MTVDEIIVHIRGGGGFDAVPPEDIPDYIDFKVRESYSTGYRDGVAAVENARTLAGLVDKVEAAKASSEEFARISSALPPLAIIPEEVGA